jgi:lambda family phage minor tail protein L
MPLEGSDELKEQKNLLEQKDPWVFLFELQLDESDWEYYTNHVEPVVWNGQTWNPFPLGISGLRVSSKGEVPTAQVTVGNVGGFLTDYLRLNNGLSGKQGNLYEVNLFKLDDPVATVIPEKFMIVGASSKENAVVFTLSLMIDAYGIEGPIESFDREKFPALPIISPKFSTGMI